MTQSDAAASSRVGASRVESLRFAPSIVQLNGMAGGVGEDRPLLPEIASIRWVFAGSLTLTRAFVEGAVEGDVGEVEPDDPVVGRRVQLEGARTSANFSDGVI